MTDTCVSCGLPADCLLYDFPDQSSPSQPYCGSCANGGDPLWEPWDPVDDEL